MAARMCSASAASVVSGTGSPEKTQGCRADPVAVEGARDVDQGHVLDVVGARVTHGAGNGLVESGQDDLGRGEGAGGIGLQAAAYQVRVEPRRGRALGDLRRLRDRLVVVEHGDGRGGGAMFSMAWARLVRTLARSAAICGVTDPSVTQVCPRPMPTPRTRASWYSRQALKSMSSAPSCRRTKRAGRAPGRSSRSRRSGSGPAGAGRGIARPGWCCRRRRPRPR